MGSALTLALAEERVEELTAKAREELTSELHATEQAHESRVTAQEQRHRSEVDERLSTLPDEIAQASEVAAKAAALIPPDPIPGPPGDPGLDGDPGVDGVGINWTGPFKPRKVYQVNDACEFEGSSYIQTVPSKGTKPPNGGWQLMAQRGADGRVIRSGSVGGGSSSGSGSGLPAGGTVGQGVFKEGVSDGDAGWEDATLAATLTRGSDPEGIPITGDVIIHPNGTDLYGILIEPQAGFEAVYNALITVLNEGGENVFNVDQGGIDLKAPTGYSQTHIRMTEVDTANDSVYASTGLNINLASGNLLTFNTELFKFRVLAPPASGSLAGSQVAFWFDDTDGAASPMWKGKSADGTVVSGSLGGGSPSFLSVAKWG